MATVSPGLPNPFPLQRWRLHARVRRAVQWPAYEGSVLRGVWGHALKRAVCVTQAPQCGGCPLQQRCAYPALFEPAPPAGRRTYGDMTPPLVIEPGGGPRELQPGEGYGFHLVLFGRALKETALIRQTWQRALTDAIGPRRGALDVEPTDIIDDGVPLPSPEATPERIRVQLLTPLFVKRQGQPIAPAAFTAADFVWSVVRRVAEVCELHLGQTTGLDFAALKRAAQNLAFTEAQWEQQSFVRWSNRQEQHTPLTGIVGSGLVEGDLHPFWPVLHLGQWLHAGGKASFGLGHYRLTPVEMHP